MATHLELPLEYQLEEAARRLQQYDEDKLMPEQHLSPSFLEHFPVIMELGQVCTTDSWEWLKEFCAGVRFNIDTAHLYFIPLLFIYLH